MTLITKQMVSDQQAVADLELEIVEHAQLKAAVDAVSALQARSLVERNGRRLKARGLLLMGEAGAGKSTVLEVIATRNPAVEDKHGRVTPVLWVEVPEETTKRALVVAIIEAMGYKVDRDYNANDLIKRIAEKVRLLGIQLIMLDEAHHILKSKEPSAVAEFLKSLLNRIGAQLLFSGLPDLKALASWRQFDRRLAPDVRLRPYDWTDVPQRLEFLIFLSRLDEKGLALPELSNLGNENVARRLYTATRGEIGLVSKYLSQALLLARTRGLRSVSLELLAEVDASWHGSVAKSQDIAFDVDLDLEADTDLDVLLADMRRVRIDPETNPFACPSANLERLLAVRIEKRDEFVKPGNRNSARAKGTGPDPLKVF
jgi:hypothetical protein